MSRQTAFERARDSVADVLTLLPFGSSGTVGPWCYRWTWHSIEVQNPKLNATMVIAFEHIGRWVAENVIYVAFIDRTELPQGLRTSLWSQYVQEERGLQNLGQPYPNALYRWMHGGAQQENRGTLCLLDLNVHSGLVVSYSGSGGTLTRRTLEPQHAREEYLLPKMITPDTEAVLGLPVRFRIDYQAKTTQILGSLEQFVTAIKAADT